MIIDQDVGALLSQLKDTVTVAAFSLRGKTGAVWDIPVLFALAGAVLHVYLRWDESRAKYRGTSWRAYVRERRKMHVATILLIAAWALDLGYDGIRPHRFIPYHSVVGFMLGYFSDSLLKMAAKRFPVLQAPLGLRRSSVATTAPPGAGDLTATREATPPPPDFDEGS